MPLTRCFSSLGCPERNAAELCQTARQFGFSAVELRSLEGKGDYAAWLVAHPEALALAHSVFRDQGIRVAVLGTSFCLTGNTQADIPALLDFARVADALEAPFVRIFGGGDEGVAMTPESIRYAAQLYLEACRRGADAGIRATWIVETHGGLVDSNTVRRLNEAAAQPVPLLWDTHHTWKLGGEALAQTWAQIRTQVRHLHCKDSRSQSAPARDYRYVVPGQGDFPFPELLRLLKREPIDAALSLEWERQWHPELPPIEDALRSWAAISE